LDKMSPLGKRHYGEQYVRLATSAYAAGDYNVALRYVNLAIHWDPLHQGAINLHHQILAAAPHLETALDEHLRLGLLPHQHPLTDFSRRGYPWRPESPSSTSLHVHISDQLPPESESSPLAP